MKCKICKNETSKIFSKVILKKYPADYYKCGNCDFVQTSETVWIEEAYNSAITSLDLGLIGRNIELSKTVSEIIDACFPEAKNMLDYAGGYGVFVRIMRDAGYNFFRQDPYCENLFTKHFDITDVNIQKFDLVTAFEVFEHFVNPMEEITKVFKFSDDLVFSTVLLPATNKETEDWWYIAPETGQHVAFYSAKTLEYIAAEFGKKYYCKNGNVHMFSSKALAPERIDYAFNNVRSKPLFFGLGKRYLNFHIQRESLLQKDFDHVKGIINS